MAEPSTPMDASSNVTPEPTLPPMRQAPPRRSVWERIKKFLGPIGVALVLLFKFAAKLKFLVLPVLKFLPVLLKTGGTMVISLWFYAMKWGWQFALGFVLLLLVHECGHMLVAKRFGLNVSVPMFIPGLGAIILLKDQPPNAWMEAWVGIGGPLLGTVGAVACEGLFHATGNPLFRGLAYTGFFLNLFNLAPIGFLDGGRIVTALSPWLWVGGLVVVGAMLISHPNFILVLILIMSLPRLFFLFRKKTAEEKRYFEVTPAQRSLMAALYFGLVAFLVAGMKISHIAPNQ